MLIFLLTVAFLAVSTNAASLGDAAVASVATTEVRKSSEQIHAGELEEFTQQGTDADSIGAPKLTALDILPYPLSIFIRVIGKEALKNFDFSSICDMVQVIDWNTYRDLLLKEDYEGFKNKVTNDEVLTSLADTSKEYFLKYSKLIMDGDTSAIDSTFNQISKAFALEKLPNLSKPCGIEKTINDWISFMTLDKTLSNGGFDHMQKYLKTLQEIFQGKNTLNSLNVSQKDTLEKELIGKGL